MSLLKLSRRQGLAVVLTAILILTVYCVLLDLSWVSENVSYTFQEVIDALMGRGTWSSEIIVRDINAPRVVIGIFVGAGLAVTGAAMQAVFKNPLASPYILGLSSGASLGAAASMLFAIPFIPAAITTPVMAFITCFLTMVLVYTMSRSGGVVKTETLILSGVAVSSLLSALVSFLTFIAGEKLEGIVFWSMGNLGNADWNEIMFAAPIITVASLFLITQAKSLNVLMLGDVHAMDLGVDVKRTRLFILIMTTVVVAAAVSFVGVIGFIGLVIPHILRILLGPDNRIIMPLSMIAGSCFILICDYLTHVIAPYYGTLPIGVVTSLIGAPLFIYLLIRRKKEVGWN
jgi:iron complex transport system permease protein